MGIEICSVGGYDEVGKNMTAVRVDDEAVIFDIGTHLENYISYTEDEEVYNMTRKELVLADAVPDDSVLDTWRPMVKCIAVGHAHLDHIAAVPFLSGRYDAPVVATPFSIAVLKSMLKDNRMKIPNKLIGLKPNSSKKIGKMTMEFIHMTHSTPQTVMIALHTKYGVIVYANDFKLDDTPILGRPPNYRRLEQISRKGVTLLIMDSLYSNEYIKTQSESRAMDMIKERLSYLRSSNNLIVVTTFSSHIARIKSIIDLAKSIDRKVMLLGRSLTRYISAAAASGTYYLPRDVEIIGSAQKIQKRLHRLEDRENSLFIVTGHQGEDKATLKKMANGKLGFSFLPGDNVIFSCKVIPTDTNMRNREALEGELKRKSVLIHKDLHVSGHASGKDMETLINILKPKNLIPSHGGPTVRDGVLRFYAGPRVHMVSNGQFLKITS